jgi:hypothetical protein
VFAQEIGHSRENPGDLMGGYFATARPPCASFIFNVLEFMGGFKSVFWEYAYGNRKIAPAYRNIEAARIITAG